MDLPLSAFQLSCSQLLITSVSYISPPPKNKFPHLRVSYVSALFYRKNCDKEKRKKLMNELQKLVRGKIKNVRKIQ